MQDIQQGMLPAVTRPSGVNTPRGGRGGGGGGGRGGGGVPSFARNAPEQKKPRVDQGGGQRGGGAPQGVQRGGAQRPPMAVVGGGQTFAAFQGEGQRPQQGQRSGQQGQLQQGQQRPPQAQQGQRPQQQRSSPAAGTQRPAQQQNPATAPAHQPVMTKESQPKPTPSGKPKSTVHLSERTFDSLTNLSDPAKRAMREHMKFERMTIVQDVTWDVIRSGKDVLAKAKTGTGKTVAFLAGALDDLVKSPNPSRMSARGISVLVISPTRELACQIETEALGLLKFQPHGAVNVCTMYGGTNMKTDERRFASPQPVDVLVATPGRLEAHMKDTPSVADRLRQGVRVLILDEADQLLEMGFRPSIERIVRGLNKERQTLLFTATVPPTMKSVLSLAMKHDHAYVDTVGEGDSVEQTNALVEQFSIVAPLENHFHALDLIIADHKAKVKDFKIIVFFPTARAAGLAATLFSESKMKDVLEIHSRLSQSARTRTSDRFRDGNQMVLFSSDVSARGLDYPGITMVVQVGLVEREQYIHRIGRTARAGESGVGVLLLAPFEIGMLKNVRDLPIKPLAGELASKINAGTLSPAITAALQTTRNPNSKMNTAAQQAYQAFLGFYKSNTKTCGLTPNSLVELANKYAFDLGLTEVPFLLKKTVGMMGLKGVPGLRVQ